MQNTRSRSPAESAKHFRYRAEELRAIANEWADSGNREVLKRVANDYDQMAEQIEKRLPTPDPR
jgi:hypothetical protein